MQTFHGCRTFARTRRHQNVLTSPTTIATCKRFTAIPGQNVLPSKRSHVGTPPKRSPLRRQNVLVFFARANVLLNLQNVCTSSGWGQNVCTSNVLTSRGTCFYSRSLALTSQRSTCQRSAQIKRYRVDTCQAQKETLARQNVCTSARRQNVCTSPSLRRRANVL